MLYLREISLHSAMGAPNHLQHFLLCFIFHEHIDGFACLPFYQGQDDRFAPLSPNHQINLPMPKFLPLVHPFRALFYAFAGSVVPSNFSHFAHGLFRRFLFLQQVFVADSKE